MGMPDSIHDGVIELALDPQKNRTGNIWHICIKVVSWLFYVPSFLYSLSHLQRLWFGPWRSYHVGCPLPCCYWVDRLPILGSVKWLISFLNECSNLSIVSTWIKHIVFHFLKRSKNIVVWNWAFIQLYVHDYLNLSFRLFYEIPFKW